MDELTTLMHSEFSVTPETGIKHRAWCALDAMVVGAAMTEALGDKGGTLDDVKRHLQEYESLTGKKINLGDLTLDVK